MDGVHLHCMSAAVASVMLFDDESNFWDIMVFLLSSDVSFFCCVAASYEWVEGLIYPEDNDILADDKRQLHEK